MKVKIKTMKDVIGLYDLGLLPFEGYEKEDDYVPFSFEKQEEEETSYTKDRSARRIRRRNARAHARKIPQGLDFCADITNFREFLVSKKKAEKANHEYRMYMAGKKRKNITQLNEELECENCSTYREEAHFCLNKKAKDIDKMAEYTEALREWHEYRKALNEAISSQREEAETKVFHKMLALASAIKECNEEVFVHFDKKQIIEKVSAFLEETL